MWYWYSSLKVICCCFMKHNGEQVNYRQNWEQVTYTSASFRTQLEWTVQAIYGQCKPPDSVHPMVRSNTQMYHSMKYLLLFFYWPYWFQLLCMLLKWDTCTYNFLRFATAGWICRNCWSVNVCNQTLVLTYTTHPYMSVHLTICYAI